jgi:N-acetylglucosaminyldiphosphoundecaprenol N-acetyl-beta-D-mannosaminyltransferase
VGIEVNQNWQRVKLLKIPVDIVAQDQLTQLVYNLLDSGKGQNIVRLSLWDLLRARRNREYRDFVKNAGLVIPISRSIVSGIRFLSGKRAVRYMPFDFVISLLTILESREFSAYLLGGKKQVLLKTEKNLRQTFPRLRIVGRYPGYYKRHEEPALVEAIRKASPSILLVGKGIRGEERWIAKNTSGLGAGLRLWCSDLFDVFAERKRYPSRIMFDYGLEWIGYCFQNPLKLFRIFPFIYYKFMLLIYKLFIR